MTERRFYTWASLLPFVLPAVSAAVAWPTIFHDTGPGNEITRLAAFISITGVFSTVPYAIALAVVFWRYRSPSSPNFRFLVWTLPLWLALGFGLVFAIPWGRGGDISNFGKGMLIGGGAALVIGYSYSLLIELTHLMAREFGWIREHPTTELTAVSLPELNAEPSGG
ncbi:MAG TPA: hypothetical protein VH277_15370 [Gemmatimonadaceae bacterium]|nr:hypothetical protein [Gemmatimonadaceae bacterium]